MGRQISHKRTKLEAIFYGRESENTFYCTKDKNLSRLKKSNFVINSEDNLHLIHPQEYDENSESRKNPK